MLAAVRVAATRLSMLETCRRVGQAICEEIGWDYVGVWVLQPADWALRCADDWIRPGSGLTMSFADHARTVRLAPGTGLPGRAWATRRVQWIDEDVRYDDDVLALIEVLGRAGRPRDQGLIEILDAIGVQIALTELRNRAELRSDVVQRELEEAREHLESIMTCAPACIATIGRDDTLLFLNRSWPFLDERQAVGESWRTMVEPRASEQMAAALSKVFAHGEHDFHEVAVKGTDGRAHWLSNHVGPVRVGGQITAAVVISQDVTKAKLAQADLADAQRLASVGTLAAGVAHEINTPVQFVSDSVHFLRDASTEIFCLIEQLESLAGLVARATVPAELLDAATAAAGAVEAADLDYLRENIPPQQEMAASDINRAVQSTLTVATSEYKYVADLDTSLADVPHVVCHVNDINQVVLNIVVNAAHAIGDVMKAQGQRGLIKVKTEQQGSDVLISIKDTGGGIPEAIRTRIFDPFFTTKEVGRGTGQGLAIARSLIEDKHGGELTFESEMGRGTTFLIRLPIAGKSSVSGQ